MDRELDYKECWVLKNWCFWTVVWRRPLRVPWTAGRSKQSILKEISSEYSLEGLMLKLKLQTFGHLIWRGDSLEKTLLLGKIESKMERGWQRMRQLNGIIDSIWVWADSRRWWRTGKTGMLQSMGSLRVRHDWMTEQQQLCNFRTDTRSCSQRLNHLGRKCAADASSS